MKSLSFWLGLALVTAIPCGYAAEYVERASKPTRQTAAEEEDIGVVAESDGTSPAPDGKSTPPPTAAKSPFRFSASARADYTTNARLSGNHASSDFIFFPTFEGAYHASLGHGFAFDAVGRIEAGVYARNDDRTFLGYSLTNTLEWRPKPNLPRIYLGIEPYRYDGFDGQGRITQAIGTTIGTDYGYGFNNGKSLAFVGYSFTDYFSNPERDTRLTHTITAGYTQMLRPNLTMQLIYQYVHELYPQFNDRQDSRHVVGLNFTYQFSEKIFSTLATSFVDSDSNQARASYQSAGVSLGVTYNF